MLTRQPKAVDPLQKVAGSPQTTGQAPPNQLTSKDLSYLEDQMSWLLAAVKKCHHYENECQDAQVKAMCQQICQTHQQQFQTLLQCCQSQAQSMSQGQAGLH